MKRLVCFVLCFLLSACLFPVALFAAGETEQVETEWRPYTLTRKEMQDLFRLATCTITYQGIDMDGNPAMNTQRAFQRFYIQDTNYNGVTFVYPNAWQKIHSIEFNLPVDLEIYYKTAIGCDFSAIGLDMTGLSAYTVFRKGDTFIASHTGTLQKISTLDDNIYYSSDTSFGFNVTHWRTEGETSLASAELIPKFPIDKITVNVSNIMRQLTDATQICVSIPCLTVMREYDVTTNLPIGDDGIQNVTNIVNALQRHHVTDPFGIGNTVVPFVDFLEAVGFLRNNSGSSGDSGSGDTGGSGGSSSELVEYKLSRDEMLSLLSVSSAKIDYQGFDSSNNPTTLSKSSSTLFYSGTGDDMIVGFKFTFPDTWNKIYNISINMPFSVEVAPNCSIGIDYSGVDLDLTGVSAYTIFKNGTSTVANYTGALATSHPVNDIYLASNNNLFGSSVNHWRSKTVNIASSAFTISGVSSSVTPDRDIKCGSTLFVGIPRLTVMREPQPPTDPENPSTEPDRQAVIDALNTWLTEVFGDEGSIKPENEEFVYNLAVKTLGDNIDKLLESEDKLATDDISSNANSMVGSISDIIASYVGTSGFPALVATLFNSQFIMLIFTMAGVFMLVGYVLFGKRG